MALVVAAAVVVVAIFLLKKPRRGRSSSSYCVVVQQFLLLSLLRVAAICVLKLVLISSLAFVLVSFSCCAFAVFGVTSLLLVPLLLLFCIARA